MAEISRVEDWGDGYVVVSFRSDTRKEGTYLKCYDGDSFRTPRDQPSLSMYPSSEQAYMKQAVTIIWRLVQGVNRQT